MTQGQFFLRGLTGLKLEFSFSYASCLTKAEEPSLSYYLPIAGGIIIGFIPFPRVLVLCEMQSVSSRIWTRVAVSIFYDGSHYTTGTSSRWYYSDPNLKEDINFCQHFWHHPPVHRRDSHINRDLMSNLPFKVGLWYIPYSTN